MMSYFTALPALILIATTASAASAISTTIKWDAVICEQAVAGTPSDIEARNSYALAAEIELRRMKANLEILTGEKLLEDGVALEDREDPFARSIAREILSNMIRANGLRPHMELVPGGANIFAEIKGKSKPEEVIELVAHYDSVGNPGADDNGSGVALLLELSRIAAKMSFGRTLRFVFTDLEEDKRQGVTGHIQLLQGGQEKVLAALVVDTIAWAPKDKPRQMAVVEVGSSEMHANGAYDRQLELAHRIAYLIKRFPVSGLVDFSFETSASEPHTADHGVYWKAGIPAFLFGQANEPGLLNPDYHKASDRISNFNWDYYLSVSLQVGGVAFSLAGYQPSDEPAQTVTEKLGELEQTQIVASQALPGPLNRSLYRTKPTYASAGSGLTSSEKKDVDEFTSAMDKYPPEDFIVGKLPKYPGSKSDRIFVIDFERHRKWEFYSLDEGSAEAIMQMARSRGIEAVLIQAKENYKSDSLLVSDTTKLFVEAYHTYRERITSRLDLEYLKPIPVKVTVELTEAAKAFVDETGISNFEERGRLLLVVVNSEGDQKIPFIVMDPVSRGIIARSSLLSDVDIESLRVYLESELNSPTVLLEAGREIKSEEDLRILASDFLASYNHEKDAQKFEYVVVTDESALKDK